MVVTQSFEAPLGSFFRRLVIGWKCISAVVVSRKMCVDILRCKGKNCFLSENFSPFFKDGLDVRMEIVSHRHSFHTFSPGVKGFTLLTISNLMLKSVFFSSSFQTWSLSVVAILLCSSLKDDLCRLNLVLNSFSVNFLIV